MAISNIQETLLMYTKQKSMINEKLSDVMFNKMNASRNSADLQAKYNEKEQDIYYTYHDYDQDTYEQLITELENEHEYELQNLNSWEEELEMQQNNYETRLNEITTFESTWTKLLQTNVKNDFTYGGVGKG